MSSRISVILVVKNGAPFFKAALESVRAQTLQPDELIVVDGRSTDDTPEVARAFGARLLVQPDDGLPNARNLGIAHATGDYLSFLDSDDVWAPAKLELQLQAMQSDPALAYITTLVQFLVEDNASPEWRARAETEFTRSVPTTSALFVRRTLFQELGVFDPTYALSCDPEWFARARDANVSTLVLPHVLTYKRLHGKNLSNRNDLTRQYMFRVARASIGANSAPPRHRPMFETPVVFTIFNRPALTARVFDVLRVVKPANLFVIADGPRAARPEDVEQCGATRAVIDQIDWECRLVKLFHNENLGVERCLSQGIRWVFDQVDAAIFVEDDTLPDPTFFPFCAAMLEQYRDDERVAMIQGTNVLGTWDANGASYFFSRFGPLWGWASWKRTWRDYDPAFTFMDAPDFRTRLAARLDNPAFAAFLLDLCERSRRTQVQSWDTQITVQQILRGALCIVSAVNPIQNLGFGPAGAHTQQRFALGANLEQHTIPFPLVAPPAVVADDEYDRRFMALTLGNPPFGLFCERVEQQLTAGRNAPALLWITRALQQGLATTDTERAELQVLYARALYALDQGERANTALEIALDAAPNFEQALALRQTWQT